MVNLVQLVAYILKTMTKKIVSSTFSGKKVHPFHRISWLRLMFTRSTID